MAQEMKESEVELIDMNYTGDISQGVAREKSREVHGIPGTTREIESTVELWVYRT
jgi:hypothetical protein